MAFAPSFIHVGITIMFPVDAITEEMSRSHALEPPSMLKVKRPRLAT